MSNALKNIEFFDVCVVHIANRLYEAFPRCLDMMTHNEVKEEYFSAIDNLDDRALIFSHTMFWLRENGFLVLTQPEERPSSSDEAHPYFMCVRLTSHGLLILKSPPKSIQKHESIGEGLKKALRSVGTEKIAGASIDLVLGIGSSILKYQ